MDIVAETKRLQRLIDIYPEEKPFIEWGPKYSLEEETIDSHHLLIVQYINLLHLMIEKESHELSIGSVFNALKEFAVIHFAYEEEFFDEVNYEHTTEHKIEHKLFTTQVDELFKKYQAGDEKMMHQLYEYLQNWLLKHILVHDKKYLAVLKNR